MTMQMNLATLWLTVLMASLFLYLTQSLNISKKTLFNFECGLNMKSIKKVTFSTNFFMVLILFLVFDVEVSLVFPILLMKSKLSTLKIVCSLFMITMANLMLKEWTQGTIEWSK